MIAGIFLDTFIVLCLLLFGGIMLGLTLVGRKFFQLKSAEMDKHVVAVKADRDQIAHQAAIQRHHQDLQLALLANKQIEPPKTEERTEVVKDKDVEVVAHPYSFANDHVKDRFKAEDAVINYNFPE